MQNIGPALTQPSPDKVKLMEKARELEAAFIAAMLGHAGFGKPDESFSGGIGEDQFASFLREAQARAIVQSGGVGLAESLFASLLRSAEQKP